MRLSEAAKLKRLSGKFKRKKYQLDALHIAASEVLSAYDAGADGEAELEVLMDMLRKQVKLLDNGI